MTRKRGYRGTIGRILAHGGSLGLALDKAASDWIEGVNSSRRNYKEGLGEYLKFYVPEIEKEYLNILNSNPNYFSDFNRISREQTAIAIMNKTHELAAKWKYKRAKDIIEKKMNALGGGGGFAEEYGAARSKESPKVVKSVNL